MSDDVQIDENPDWTEADFAKAEGPETLSAVELAAFPRTRVRSVQKSPTKRPISLRVDADILESYRATGPGWQGRMNDALRKAMPRA